MTYSIKIQAFNDKVLLVNISGILEQGNCNAFINEVLSKYKDSMQFVIFDLTNAIYISPSGLESFEIIHKKLSGQNTKVILLNLPELVVQQIDRYGINNKIGLCSNNDDLRNIIGLDRCTYSNSSYREILVMSENELIDRIRNGTLVNYDHCISIRNPDEFMNPIISKNFQNTLELKFYDAYDINHLGPMQKIKRIPEEDDIIRLIDFYNKNKDKGHGFVIHCWQGISRSTAIALCILYLKYKSEIKAKNELLLIRPEARPHLLITQLFDRVMKCNLTQVAQEIRSEVLEKLKNEIEPPASI
jgi:predicted protein tyrosine phosphatase/anti-anti-sigma regulatory factor